MTRPGDWVLLAYRLPREPSAPRLAVWRKLKRLGVAQLLDGLVALPLDSRNREQLEWIAEQVVEADGEASIWVASPAAIGDERELATKMQRSIAEQYRTVIEQARDADPSHRNRRTLARLRRELGRMERRDYFPPPEREAAREAVEALAATLDEEAVR
jgi:DNA-binding transcriptional regulator PaaX